MLWQYILWLVRNWLGGGGRGGGGGGGGGDVSMGGCRSSLAKSLLPQMSRIDVVDSGYIMRFEFKTDFLGTFLLTWIDFNLNMTTLIGSC